MFSKKPQYVQDPPAYVFLGVTTQIHLSGPQTGGEHSSVFPEVERLLALAEEFGIRILAPPELPVRM
jgi:hypothetical protein